MHVRLWATIQQVQQAARIILCHHNVTLSHQGIEDYHYMTLRKRGISAKLV
jgi:hypothetical protein